MICKLDKSLTFQFDYFSLLIILASIMKQRRNRRKEKEEGRGGGDGLTEKEGTRMGLGRINGEARDGIHWQ